MSPTVDVTPYGRAALDALATRVAAVRQASSPLSPITVIVPSNFAGLTARRHLGSAASATGGIANVSFITPLRLVEQLAPSNAARSLTNPVLAAAVRQTLAHHEGSFHHAREHRATESAIAALAGELFHVSPESLHRMASGSGSSLASEAVALHRGVAERLSGSITEDDLARSARARPDFASAVSALGHVIWYLPGRVTPAIGELLSAALDVAPSTVLVGTSRDAGADAAVRATCERVGLQVPPFATTDAPTASHIVSVTDADEEVRAVVRRIVELARGGTPLHRIGVFYPVRTPYLRVLRQQLDAAGIPSNGPSPDRLSHSAAGRTIIAALSLPDERWRRDRVMALIADAPVLAESGAARPAAWERLSRAAGIVGDQWSHRLDALSGQLTKRRDEQLASGKDTAATSFDRDIADLAQLKSFVERLIGSVGAVSAASSWAEKAAATSTLLHELLGTDRQWQRWPPEEQYAAQSLQGALARLAQLDDIDPNPKTAVFRRALVGELDVSRGRSASFGRGVAYGPLISGIGHDFDAVFVVGMAEGQCPSPRGDDALLPDSVRKLANGELALRSEGLEDQHRAFLAVLASAPAGHRTLTFPRGDLRAGRNRLPSRWLLDSASALAGRTIYSTDFDDLTSASCPGLVVVASQAAGLDAAHPANLQDWEVASLYQPATGSLTNATDLRHPAFDPVRRGLDCVTQRGSSSFTEWDGNLAGEPVPSPAGTGEVMSATRLQRWAECGMRYYFSHVLGLGERDDPEEILELSALERGSAIHEILERFIGERIDAGTVPEPGDAWNSNDRSRIREIAREVFVGLEQRGLTGRPIWWRLKQDEILGMTDRFLDVDSRFRAANGARPLQVEMAFGMHEQPAVDIDLGEGRTIKFRGAIDRVDVSDGGRHIVSDYKSGKPKRYDGIVDGDPVAEGTSLQLGLYSEAARQHLGADAVSARYWMLESDSPEAPGYTWDEARRRRFLDVIGATVDGIEGGVFPMEPGEWSTFSSTHDQCRYCDFTSICPTARADQAQAKSDAPELAVRDRLMWDPS